MSEYRNFGASIGKALLEAGASDDAPKVAAAQFVAGAVEVHPRVKAPALLGNNAVQEWMERAGISENILRSALTNERRARRERAAKEATVRVPPRSRGKRAAATASGASKPTQPVGGAPLGSEVVPNRSLDLL